MRILHLPTSVGGNAWGLAQAEKLLGLDSQVLTIDNNFWEWNTDYKLETYKTNLLCKLFPRLAAFLTIRNRYNVFHFNSGRSLISLKCLERWQSIDLPFYPRRTKLFVTYNGCDARQKYPTIHRTCLSACGEADCYEGICNSGEKDRLKRVQIARMAKYVKHMWALNPDLLYFLPPEKSSFLPYTVGQFKIDPSPICQNKKLYIVHAPTNRAAKGSGRILSALEKLQQKYPERLEVVTVEKTDNKAALKIYRKADLIIDQILIGWYGAFAVEAMLMGKPVIARIARDDLKFVPKQMAKDLLETIINANPLTIHNVLERCINDPQFLKRRAEASLEYVSKWHDPLYVASLTKQQYENGNSVYA